MRYTGRNHIEFSCDDVKNVTVVLGDNTVGKTTIAQAFRWGLYGALMANGTKSAGDFQLLNTDILEMMDANSRAKVKVEITAVDEEKRYIITRETTYTRAFPKLESREFQKKCAMRITELEDMESYVEVDSNEIETLINELFPKNLSHYFLFDGERWNDVSVGGVRENIKESVHILTGLSAYREAKNHLKDMGSNSVIKKFRSEIKGSGAVYDNLEAERKKLERDIEKLRDEIEVLEVNIRNYEKKNEDIERFLAENHNTEELQRKKKHLELLCESQRKQSLYSYKTLVNAISDKAYMVFARSMLRASMELLKSAKMERRDIPYMRQATIDYIIKNKRCICGHEIKKDSSEYFALMEQRNYLPPADVGSIIGDFERTANRWYRKGDELLEEIDDYAKEETQKVKAEVKKRYEEYSSILKELEEKDIDKEQQQRELSFLEFEIQELEDACLREGEDEELEKTYRKMLNGKKIAEACGAAYRLTSENGESASDQIGRALREISAVTSCDAELQPLEEQLEQLDGLLNDFNRDMSSYLSGLEFEEEDFYETEKRLDELNHLKSKYGDTIEKVLEAKEEKIQRRDELLDYDAYLNQLKEQKKASEEALEKASKKLSKIRKKYAKELCRQVTEHLLDLNFETVDLSMEFEQTTHFTSNGYDEVEFLISTNPGETPKPLGKIASGGELSRIMLALKTVLANNDEIETLIFDEIDTGISGRTAQKVSEKMDLIGRNHQVICITHLPQIAAMADTHFLIEKTVESGRTTSKIHRLPQEESVAELSRMLGGVSITETVLENAKEMKELAAKTKKS